MKSIFYLSILLFSATFTSCKKESTEETGATPPKITFSSPGPMQAFSYGDTVKIKGTITGSGMHGYNVRMANASTGMNVINQSYHEHGDSFTINESWKNTVTDTAYMQITVDVAIDHDGSIQTQQAVILCYPQ